MGGIERALTTLANHFVERGHQVVFISCLRGHHFYALDPRIDFQESADSHKTNRIGKALFYVKLCAFIRSSVKKADPDVVLSFGDSFNPLVLLSLRWTKFPVYISDRISPTQALPRYVKWLKRIFYPYAKGIIAQTTRAAEHKFRQFGSGIHLIIIPNAIRKIVKTDIKRENLVLYAGRLSYEKGPDRLIEALARIEQTSDWHYAFAGEGPQKALLQQMAEEKGLDRIEFLGNVKDIDALFQRAKIFVIPSRTEGFPNALAEAMANGCAPISFDSIPCGDLINDKQDGIIVQDGDIEALSQAIMKLMTDEPYRARLAEKAQMSALQFGVETIGDQYLNFILP